MSKIQLDSRHGPVNLLLVCIFVTSLPCSYMENSGKKGYDNKANNLSTTSEDLVVIKEKRHEAENIQCNISVDRIYNGSYVDCSHRKLTTIPGGLPENATTLLLQGNNITNFSNQNLSHLRDLRLLDLSCHISVQSVAENLFDGLEQLTNLKMENFQSDSGSIELPPKLFARLSNLQNLSLVNWTGDDVWHLRNITSVTNYLNNTESGMDTLDLSSVNSRQGILWILQPPLFKSLHSKRIKTLRLRSNNIISIEPGVFDNFKYLVNLDLSHNIIIAGHLGLFTLDLPNMTMLETLDMSYQNFIYFPPDGEMSYENMGYGKILQQRRRRAVSKKLDEPIRLPPKLKKLHLNNRNSVIFYTQKSRNVSSNNSLEMMDLSCNWMAKIYFGQDFNYPHLTHLDMSKSKILYMHPVSFRFMKSLKVLNLSNLELKIADHRHSAWSWINLFNVHFQNMTSLDISYNGLTNISDTIFEHAGNLEELFAGSNKLRRIPNINKLAQLKLLDISNNSFTMLNKKDLDILANQTNITSGNVTVNVTGNRFSCNCSDIDFVRWLFSYSCFKCRCNKIYFINLSCTSLEDSNVIINGCDNVPDLYHNLTHNYDCMPPWVLTSKKASFSVYCVVLVIIALCSVSLRYKWYLLYAWYYTKTVIHQRRQREEPHHALYDAFVCYCQKDYRWVLRELHPYLESQSGYRLSIHQRDFTVGAPIDVNILQAFSQSRRVILVISRHALRSRFLNFELHIAREQCPSRIVCVLLEEEDRLPKSLIPPTLQYLLSTTTYIEWPQLASHRPLFWLRLKHSLGPPSDSTAQPCPTYLDTF